MDHKARKTGKERFANVVLWGCYALALLLTVLGYMSAAPSDWVWIYLWGPAVLISLLGWTIRYVLTGRVN
jgi:hypothetical protein